MAQALEKVFRGKVAQMPKEEIKIETASSKTVKKKPPKPPTGTFVGGIAPSPSNPITKPQQPTPAKQISNLEQSFVLPSETSGAAAATLTSTPKAPISSTPDVQSNLHNLINQQATPANASQISTSSAPFLVNQQPAMNTVPVSAQQPAKVKKGVKRKADTTTPTAMGFNESSDVKALRGRQVN